MQVIKVWMKLVNLFEMLCVLSPLCRKALTSLLIINLQLSSQKEFGRPKFEISRKHLSFLLENRFMVCQISDMLSVSKRTV